MEEMNTKERSGENRIFTIPNAMSMFRILLIPLIVWLYKVRRQYYAVVAVLLLSGLTDALDGLIARKFNMVSNLGKVLDPVADKLTQGTLLITIATEHPRMLFLVTIMIVKETLMVITGLQVIKKTGKPYSAKWHGKAATFLLDLTVIVHVIWRGIPLWFSILLVALCAGFMLYSMVQYSRLNRRMSRCD